MTSLNERGPGVSRAEPLKLEPRLDSEVEDQNNRRTPLVQRVRVAWGGRVVGIVELHAGEIAFAITSRGKPLGRFEDALAAANALIVRAARHARREAL